MSQSTYLAGLSSRRICPLGHINEKNEYKVCSNKFCFMDGQFRSVSGDSRFNVFGQMVHQQQRFVIRTISGN